MATATMTAEVETTETAAASAPQQAHAAAWTPTPEWFLAGKAQFTVSNGQGQHYSYEIVKKEDRKGNNVWFLTLLSGPDNNRDFQYVGLVGRDGSVKLTRNSKVSADAKSYKVAVWALKQVWTGKTLPDGYEINHKGRCGRCGRELTRPEGVSPKGYRFGYGETCYKALGLERAKLVEVAPQQATGSPPPATLATDRVNQAVAIVESKRRAADHVANRFESAAERFWRQNREAIEADDATVGVDYLY